MVKSTKRTYNGAGMSQQRFDIKQFQYESDSWKRLLAFIRDENIHLKQRLSESLLGMNNIILLNRAESFQNRFLMQDELISVLKDDLAEFDRSLIKEIYLDGAFVAAVEKMHANIRSHMVMVEKGFNELKQEFSNYLLGLG